MMRPIRRLLVANRGEIAQRVIRTARSLGIATVAIHSRDDTSAHRHAADRACVIGGPNGPLGARAYLDIDAIVRIARECEVDAIHPGYGFLSENPAFAEACDAAGIVFVGPSAATLRALGDKVSARRLAADAGLPVLPGTEAITPQMATTAVARLGAPVLVKAAWGGGGRGMRRIDVAADAPRLVEAAAREATAAFGRGDVYLEKMLPAARHVEVQILGDTHGNVVHLFERDCTVQRRHQKLVEQAPAPWLAESERHDLCELAVRLARHCGYVGAGTVEFLMDATTRRFHFIEVNPRIQVEHTISEEITGVDIVRAQLMIAAGVAIGTPESGVPEQARIVRRGASIQCRVVAESAAAGFVPSEGRLAACTLPAGLGVRVETVAATGAQVSAAFDSLVAKVIVTGGDRTEAVGRMRRALDECRIAGVETNLPFLRRLFADAAFLESRVDTEWVDAGGGISSGDDADAGEDRLIATLARIVVEGHPDVRGRGTTGPLPQVATLPAFAPGAPVAGTRQRFEALGPTGFARWMRETPQLLVTDTTVREAQQSLVATRLRTADIAPAIPHYAARLPQLLSLECWGGATFDVMLRYLAEDPWARLTAIRSALPNVLLQMMLRGANAVGYTRYPQPVVARFVRAARHAGIDVFRIFDALNLVDNMRGAMDAVIEAGGLCQPTLCYTADLFDAARPKYALGYYVERAKALERAGAHVLAIKDMAGVCRPAAAAALVRALREEVGLPIQLNNHDTGGLGVATLLAAADAGVDAIDCALDAFSGLTAQPMLGAVVHALRGTPRDTGLDPDAVLVLSRYFEDVRRWYAPFEVDLRAGTSEVFRHEMPGGQYTNLREQARGLGLGERWPEIAARYAEVNRLFGDIVKITPTSKIVADLALLMVMRDLSIDDLLDPAREIAFPASVVSLLRGDLGWPDDGFPAAIRRRALRTPAGAPDAPHTGDVPPQLDVAAAEAACARLLGRTPTEHEQLSHLMFPDVFAARTERVARDGDVTALPTRAYFHGLRPGEAVAFARPDGRVREVRLAGTAPVDGGAIALFEVDGAPRPVFVPVAASTVQAAPARPRARDDAAGEVGAPMPGQVVKVAVATGETVRRGQPLLWLEAMKMQTEVVAACDGSVAAVHVRAGEQVAARDLLVSIE